MVHGGVNRGVGAVLQRFVGNTAEVERRWAWAENVPSWLGRNTLAENEHSGCLRSVRVVLTAQEAGRFAVHDDLNFSIDPLGLATASLRTGALALLA